MAGLSKESKKLLRGDRIRWYADLLLNIILSPVLGVYSMFMMIIAGFQEHFENYPTEEHYLTRERELAEAKERPTDNPDYPYKSEYEEFVNDDEDD